MLKCSKGVTEKVLNVHLIFVIIALVITMTS